MKLLIQTGVAVAVAAPAYATTTISFFDHPETPADQRATLECSAACEALFGVSGDFDDLIGGIFTVHPPNPGNQLDFVDANLAPGDSPFSEGFKTEIFADDEDPTDDDFSFSTLAQYVLIKIGGGNTLQTALVRNISGGSLGLTWMPVAGTGSGLSHFTEFGAVSQVPLPAAGWLLLTGLGAIGFTSRRRRAG